jgi:PAS domain S-box-containing protein
VNNYRADVSVTISLAAGLTVIAIGALVLVGWASDIELLKRIYPHFTAMNPLTAFCLVFSGVALLLARWGYDRAAGALGVTIVLVAIGKFADIASGHVPIDQLLFADELHGKFGPSNAMAPNTALALMLLGVALIFSVSARRSFMLISQCLALSIIMISLFAVVGYAFGIDHLNAVGAFIPMALHTGVTLAIVSVGVMALTPHCGIMLVLRDPGSAGSMARFVLPLAIFIPIVVGALRLWGQKSGFYGTGAGVALMVVANVLITSVLLIASILALYRSDEVRRCREEDLARSDTRHRLAAKVAQVGHWRMNLPSLQISWSDEAFQISGLPKCQGMPSPAAVLDIFHPDDRQLVRQSVRGALRESRDWAYVVRVCRPDGELRHISSHGVCEHDENGLLTGVFGVFADITELENARRKSEESTAMKAAFLANMSHEIRTPMNGVLGFTELLASSRLDDTQQSQVELIAESGRAMMRLLNDILDMSKMDSGQMRLTAEPIDLGHKLRNCARLMEPAARAKGVVFIIDLDPALPKWVLGDPLRLRQILLNLIGNAVKFTDRGSIAVRAHKVADQLSIEVADSGVGIPADRLENIFQQFSQGDASIARKYGGTGLGLSISAELAKLMGGSIAVTSMPGHGSTFNVMLPLIEAADMPGPETVPNLDNLPIFTDHVAARPRVLIAEDHDINQLLITALAQSAGLEPVIAANGKEAVDMVREAAAAGEPFALVLMDVQMPLVDGLEATRQLRALGFTAEQLPIVALTANAYSEDKAACLAAGMQQHVAKPVRLRDLNDLALRYIGTAPKRPAERASIITDPTIKSVAQRYQERRTATLDAIATNARSMHLDSATVTELASMLHKLAGTAGFFGEATLGKLASKMEQDLNEATPDDWGIVLASGWADIKAVA